MSHTAEYEDGGTIIFIHSRMSFSYIHILTRMDSLEEGARDEVDHCGTVYNPGAWLSSTD